VNIGELKVKEDAFGELYFDIPQDVLDRLGWQEGDDIKFIEKDDGFIIKKVKYESVELEFDKKELLEYMKFAHDQNITFNQLCENAINEKLNEVNRK
jgi:bifunctional DNA-binding transcriptional regulator/antitoxin component of YhaV-PrlF toxin-antitoxin module